MLGDWPPWWQPLAMAPPSPLTSTVLGTYALRTSASGPLPAVRLPTIDLAFFLPFRYPTKVDS
jgi:hypothetical protein